MIFYVIKLSVLFKGHDTFKNQLPLAVKEAYVRHLEITI